MNLYCVWLQDQVVKSQMTSWFQSPISFKWLACHISSTIYFDALLDSYKLTTHKVKAFNLNSLSLKKVLPESSTSLLTMTSLRRYLAAQICLPSPPVLSFSRIKLFILNCVSYPILRLAQFQWSSRRIFGYSCTPPHNIAKLFTISRSQGGFEEALNPFPPILETKKRGKSLGCNVIWAIGKRLLRQRRRSQEVRIGLIYWSMMLREARGIMTYQLTEYGCQLHEPCDIGIVPPAFLEEDSWEREHSPCRRVGIKCTLSSAFRL